MDDKDLIKRARDGDKEAFAKLYIKHKDSLYRYAYFKLRSVDDAGDAVSACIVQAYMGIASLKNEKAFSSWLFRILYRECCAVIKRRADYGTPDELSGNEQVLPDNTYLAPELCEALDILSSEDREIVLLSAVAGYNSREISKMLNINPATVRSKLSRGLNKMRNFLE